MDNIENMETFATVAFSFVLGYAERALHNHSKEHPCKLVNGEFVPTGEKTEATRRLEVTVAELHRLWNVWNGMEG